MPGAGRFVNRPYKGGGKEKNDRPKTVTNGCRNQLDKTRVKESNLAKAAVKGKKGRNQIKIVKANPGPQ